MAEQIVAAEGGEEDEPKVASEATGRAVMSRKEKRKAAKKLKRKQARREAALKEREEEEARINDPEEQLRVRLMEEEEARRVERERKEFEERERLWIEAMEKKKKQAEEEEERRGIEESEKDEVENHHEFDVDGEWEYVEEGPAEIIWQGNEIIVKKKKVRVAKKDVERQTMEVDIDRPTSNPLPPQSEAFADYKNAPNVSAQKVLENVAQQIPNFGTEQDKAHCPFHFKTGACRFGHSCSRVHFYPDKSCTLLIKNMYNGPGLAWEQDEGLEHTDEEVERCYEEFYEDVHTEFLKFGEIVNFKVCKNASSHLRGNVYVHYQSLDSAMLAYHSINGRYFAGKQVSCEFVGVTRWKVAICGEYMKSRMKTCSRGTACNFIHCFCNPGGDYEWADLDKPPPKYWVRKMAALFGYSDEYPYDKDMERGGGELQRNTGRTKIAEADRFHSSRSRSRDMDYLNSASARSLRDENHVWNDKEQRSGGRKRNCPDKASLQDFERSKNITLDNGSDGGQFNRGDVVRGGRHDYARKSSKQRHGVTALPDEYGDSWKDTHESDPNRDRLSSVKSGKTRLEYPDSLREADTRTHETCSYGDWSDPERDWDRRTSSRRKRSKHQNGTSEVLDDHWDGKRKTIDSDSAGSDRDGHAGKSTRYKEAGLHRDHGDSKNRGHDYASDIRRSNGDRDGEKRHSCRMGNSKWLDQSAEFVDDHNRSKNRINVGDFSEDLSDHEKGRYCTNKRKHESERLSHDDKKLENQKVRKHGHSSRKGSSRKKKDVLGGDSKSFQSDELCGVDQYGERSQSNGTNSRFDHGEDTKKIDVESGISFPVKDCKSKRKRASDEYYGPESPGRYDGRFASQDLDSEYYSDEFI